MREVSLSEKALPPPIFQIHDGAEPLRVVVHYAGPIKVPSRPDDPPIAGTWNAFKLALLRDASGEIRQGADVTLCGKHALATISPHDGAFLQTGHWDMMTFGLYDADDRRRSWTWAELCTRLAGETLPDLPLVNTLNAVQALELSEHMARLEDEQNAYRPLRWFAYHRRLTAVLTFVVETLYLNNAAGDQGDELPVPLRVARAHIERNYRQVVSLHELADLSGWSAPYLCTRFREVFGTTPREYQLTLQMRAARALLAESGLRVNEIATLVGFASRHNFSRLFRERVGVSPKAYRELN